MVKNIIRDVLFLKRKSTLADKNDTGCADDLLDTLKFHSEDCVGLAANMIGVSKCIIVFQDENGYNEMFNPEIIKMSDCYETEEGCLSLDGVRKVKRYKTIKVKWQTRDFKIKIKTFNGFPAQIIQHEIDHTKGIII